MQKQPLVVPNKSCKSYFIADGVKVYFSGDFDSGNLQKVEQISPYVYKIHPGYDKVKLSTRKTFFHFKVTGLKMCNVRFHITKMHLLQQFIRLDGGGVQFYHPVARRSNQGQYSPIKTEVKLYYNSLDEPQLSFMYNFQNDSSVQFAFTYPYSYEDNQQLIKSLKNSYSSHPDIYFHAQTLCYTSQSRRLQIITITSRNNCEKTREDAIEDVFIQGEERPFKIDKPKIVLTARVHPGQTPSSYAIEGALRFLLNEKDYRSYILRKHFHFIIIPMLNPEGVYEGMFLMYEGMFRNDLNGDNLNRMYLACERRKQYVFTHMCSIGIWSVRRFVDKLENVGFFFDFHAHPSRKGFFIYGNAFEEFTQQVEAQIFSKMIETNCPYFQNLDCIYSERAMNSKDKHEHHSKEGCARVYYHKTFDIIHSYTVECGYFAPTKLNPFSPLPDVSLMTMGDYQKTDDWEKVSMKGYTPQSYMLMGKSILITILDLFHMNPFSRVTLGEFKSINTLRKFTAQRIYNQVQRFRLIDSNCYRKIKEIASIVDEDYYKVKFGKYNLSVSENYGMKMKKKTFSLKAKVYHASSVSVKTQAKSDLEQLLQNNRQQQQLSHQQRNYFQSPEEQCKIAQSVSEKEIGIHSQMHPTFQRYSKDDRKYFRVGRLAALQANSKNNHNYSKQSPKLEDRRFKASSSQQMYTARQRQLSKSKESRLDVMKIRKIEEEVLKEIVEAKIAAKRTSDHSLFKVERIGAFLKKEATKNIAKDPLPLIQAKSIIS